MHIADKSWKDEDGCIHSIAGHCHSIDGHCNNFLDSYYIADKLLTRTGLFDYISSSHHETYGYLTGSDRILCSLWRYKFADPYLCKVEWYIDSSNISFEELLEVLTLEQKKKAIFNFDIFSKDLINLRDYKDGR